MQAMTHSQLLLIFFTAVNFVFNIHAEYVATTSFQDKGAAILKRSVQLTCKYVGGDNNGQFLEWYKDSSPIKNEKVGHYEVITTEKETTLTIKIFVIDDSQVNLWTVKTNKDGYKNDNACNFSRISVTSTPQGILTNRPNEKIDKNKGSIRRSENEFVSLKCSIEPNDQSIDRNDIEWHYGSDGETYGDLPDGVVRENSDIKIDQTKRFHNGYYRCTLNNESFSILLRVKDRLAALWPFIGIVGVVIILVIIILIFEKRQKSNKKSSTDDEDQDQANDPLVRTTTSPSDNDNKKRAINA